MRHKPGTRQSHGEKVVKDIRRATRKQYSSEEKIRIVLDGLKGEDSIAELCRREGMAQSLYYSWSKEFLEAGKKRLAGDTARAATSTEAGWAEPLAEIGDAVSAGQPALNMFDLLSPDKPPSLYHFAADGVVLARRLHAHAQPGNCLFAPGGPL